MESPIKDIKLAQHYELRELRTAAYMIRGWSKIQQGSGCRINIRISIYTKDNRIPMHKKSPTKQLV
jgi:hypothetical protein